MLILEQRLLQFVWSLRSLCRRAILPEQLVCQIAANGSSPTQKAFAYNSGKILR